MSTPFIESHGILQSESPSPQRLRLNITGFGRFHGVEDNPTSHIVNKAMETGGLLGLDPQLLETHRMSVVVVDIPHCDEILQSLGDPSTNEITIHLGVNSRAPCVHVEQFAYNNKSFRVPDECGLQPCDEKIDLSCDLECPVQTNFPVVDIVSELQREGHSIVVSSDPGRFICNYIYYSSIMRYQRVGLPYNALFIHLPPFEVLDYDSQVRAVAAVINAIGRRYLACM